MKAGRRLPRARALGRRVPRLGSASGALASDGLGNWVPMVAAGGVLRPSSRSTGSPALAGTPLATIKGWGAVRLAMQARARASRFTGKMRKFNLFSFRTSLGAPL